jgi:thiol-disulfide isomerase/thioredoxin
LPNRFDFHESLTLIKTQTAMKIIALLSLMFACPAIAGFEKWTNKDGKAAELDLIKVTVVADEKVGEFKMRNGKTIKLKAVDLSPEAAEKLKAWSAPVTVAAAEPTIFDKLLDGNLVKLEGKSLKKFEMVQQPKKFYVFYYTASWCGPCQQFTPSLVEFYNKNKNENFELVLITSDQDENDMEGYAKDKKMPWPQLKLKKAQAFKKEFQHGVTGIPSLIVCDTTGKMLGNYRSNLAELATMVK